MWSWRTQRWSNNQATHTLWDSRAILDGNFMQVYFTERKATAPPRAPSSSSSGASWFSLGGIVGLVLGFMLAFLALRSQPTLELDRRLTDLHEEVPTAVADNSTI